MYYNKKKRSFASWWDLFLNGYYVTGAATAIRRELFEKAYPFSDIWQHDGWLAIFASLFGEIEEESAKLIKYRQHAKNQIGAESSHSLKAQISGKLEIIKKGAEAQSQGHDLTYKRYKELIMRSGENLDREKRKKLKNAIIFRRRIKKLSGKKKMKSMRIILNSWIRGDYKRFCKKSFGTMMGDCIFLFLK